MRDFAFVCSIPFPLPDHLHVRDFLTVGACAALTTDGYFPFNFLCLEKTLMITPPKRRCSLDELPRFFGSLAAWKIVFLRAGMERRAIPVLDCAPRVDASELVASEHVERILREQQRALPARFGRRFYEMNFNYEIQLRRANYAAVAELGDEEAPSGTMFLTLRGLQFSSRDEYQRALELGLPGDAYLGMPEDA